MAQARSRAGRGFKGQPWLLYDTVASSSFLIGDTVLAIGTQIPAINAKGEMIFFNAGRTRNKVGEHLTSKDQDGQLSYGFEVWAIYVHAMFPILPAAELGAEIPTIAGANLQTAKLYEALINGSALIMGLGQEEQMIGPLHRFGAGGGLQATSSLLNHLTNGQPFRQHVLVLPEPIEMPRTFNISATIKLGPEAMALVGTPANPGVGAPLCDFEFTPCGEQSPVQRPELPYMLQVGLVGRRVKRTQYGQTTGGKS